jgi:hypothetical protein
MLYSARETREAAFRARGVTLAETVDRITDALVIELQDEAADEMTSFIDQYAERFLNQI